MLFSRHALLLILAVLVLRADSAWANVLRFDVDAANAPADETQAGFTRMTDPAMNGNAANGTFAPTATVDGVTVTATQVVGSSRGFRDRGVGGPVAPPGPFQNVLRDFIFSEGVDGSEIEVTVSGLGAGVYQFNTYHHDWNVGGNAANVFDILVTDARGTDQLLIDDGTFVNAGTDTGQEFIVASDGVNDIVLRVIEDSATNRTRFNGLSIVAVPEPHSLAVWGLLGLAGYGYQRRRNQ